MTLAKAIFKKCYLKGEFVLSSGQVSGEYFDKYQFTSDPFILRQIVDLMVPLVPSSGLLGGMDMGGIPLATALSLQTGQGVIFVRKEAKNYGTCKLAEGSSIEGKSICLIEDIVTTGGQVVASAGKLRKLGAKVEKVLAVVDRSGGDHSKFHQARLEFKALFTLKELKTLEQ